MSRYGDNLSLAGKNKLEVTTVSLKIKLLDLDGKVGPSRPNQEAIGATGSADEEPTLELPRGARRPLYVPENLGSATHAALDARSEAEGFITQAGVRGNKPLPNAEEDIQMRGAPWGVLPSLKEMTSEVGIDFDAFLEALKQGISDEELAVRWDAPLETIRQLRVHFQRRGIDSVMGQD